MPNTWPQGLSNLSVGTLVPNISQANKKRSRATNSHADNSSLMPVTILTGFLGSGKTTCLNAFLRTPQAANVAVLINEFGEIDVDGAVLSEQLADGSKMVTLPNGCVCCAVQEDLVDALLVLARRAADPAQNIRRCIIETTGLADPGAIVRGIGHDPRLKTTTRVEQTLTVCAADRLSDQLERFDEVARQIGIADRIYITKGDLVDPRGMNAAHSAIAAINPIAEISEAINGEIDANRMFGSSKASAISDLQSAEHHVHHHTSSVQTFTIHLDRALDPGRFRDTMSFMIMRHAENLLRIKGIVRFAGENTPRLLNGVHDVFSSERTQSNSLAEGCAGSIVFIGVDLPEDTIRSDLVSSLS
jgi:G3E family GTPase